MTNFEFLFRKTVSNTKVFYPERKIKLLLLDLNGVLCWKTERTKPNIFKPMEYILLPNGRAAVIRPYARKFLNWCFSRFHMGVFSSTTSRNVTSILKKLLSKSQKKKLKFIWCRDQCELDPEYGENKSITNFDTIKPLDKIISNPVINHDRKYTLNDILIIDDSEQKLRFNLPANYLIVKSFDSSNLKTAHLDDELLKLKYLLSSRLTIDQKSNENKSKNKS